MILPQTVAGTGEGSPPDPRSHSGWVPKSKQAAQPECAFARHKPLTPHRLHLFFGDLCETEQLAQFPPRGWVHGSTAVRCGLGVLPWRLCLQNTHTPHRYDQSVPSSAWQITRLLETLVEHHLQHSEPSAPGPPAGAALLTSG